MTTGEEDAGAEPAEQQEVSAAEPAEADKAAEDTPEEMPEEQDPNEGDDGDDGEVEREGEEDPVDPEPEAKPASRAQARIRKQAEELKSERAEKEKLIAERATYAAQLEQLRQQQQQFQTAEQQRQEQSKLALLTPEERASYESNKKISQLEFELNKIRVQQADDRDRAQFHAKAAHDPMYSKYAAEVEDAYQDGLKRGVNAPREELLAWRLGKELLKNKGAVAGKKKEAAKRIGSVTAKAVNAKGDVAGSRKGKSEEDRLRGVLI